MQGLDRRLAERTLELVDIASESGDEARILEHVAGVLAGVDGGVHADADGLLLVPPRSGRSLVVLAGHLDTVPAQGNRPGHVEDGAIVGLGASDMKGACAVILELALWADRARPQRAVDLGFLLFGREELPSDRSALRPLLARLPVLGETALAVVMEPTDNTLQVGCLGNLTAEVRFAGRSAHSARPWLGVNAIHAAVNGLAAVAALPPRPVVIQGLEYREVVSVVRISAGIADNVISDLAICRINYRYAPDRTPAEAETRPPQRRSQLERQLGALHRRALEARQRLLRRRLRLGKAALGQVQADLVTAQGEEGERMGAARRRSVPPLRHLRPAPRPDRRTGEGARPGLRSGGL